MRFPDLLETLRALAEPTRLRLVALLSEAELTVSELVEILGQSQPRISRHLKLLSEAGLLERAAEGVHAYFRLAAGEAAARLARTLIDMTGPDDPTRALDLQRLAEIRRSRAVTADSYFRRHAADWDAIRSLHIPEAEVESAIRALLPQSRVGDLLDLGTGTGRMLQLGSAVAERAIGVDLSREMLAVARAHLDQPEYRHCTLRQAPIEKLPFPAASFDVVLCHMVLHFLVEPALAINEAGRVLKPGGRLILVDFAPHDARLLGPEHAHRWAGFADPAVADWLGRAGLEAGAPVTLPGNPLTVKIWSGERPDLPGLSPPQSAHQPSLELYS